MLSALLLLAAAPNTVESRLGVCLHLNDSTPAEFPAVRKAGFGAVRTDLPWAEIEGQRGVYRWEKFDRAAQGLKAAGLHPLFILFGPNPAYGDESPRTPEARAAFARFSGLAAARYKGYGADFEIWNEPNHRGFWKPEPNARDYVELVKAVSAAVRAADPKARILAGSVTEPLWPFLEQSFRLGMLDSIDAVAVHPYRPQRPESLIEDVARLRRMIAGATPRKVGISFTEIGYPMSYAGQDQYRRARYIPRAFLVSLVAGVESFYLYQWKEKVSPGESQFGFGINDERLAPLPSGIALGRLMTSLKGMRYEKRLPTASPEDFLLSFVGGAKRKIVGWTGRYDPSTVPEVSRDAGLRMIPTVRAKVKGRAVTLGMTPRVISSE